MTNKTINFDVAHALVDYLARDGDNSSYTWGNTTTREIKTRICELKDSRYRVNLSKLTDLLVASESGKLCGDCDKKLIHLRQLLKEVAK